MFFRFFSSRKIRAARIRIATAPTAMPAIAPAGSVEELVEEEEVVEGTAEFDEVAEVTADEADAVAWPDVVLDVELLVVLLVVLELEVLVELELILEAEG